MAIALGIAVGALAALAGVAAGVVIERRGQERQSVEPTGVQYIRPRRARREDIEPPGVMRQSDESQWLRERQREGLQTPDDADELDFD